MLSTSIRPSSSTSIRNRSAQAASARARIARERNLATIRRLELLIATEVRTAARAVETNFKRVESTRAARVLQERRLDAEEKKFAAGMSTNFLVTQAQRDLAMLNLEKLQDENKEMESIITSNLILSPTAYNTGLVVFVILLAAVIILRGRKLIKTGKDKKSVGEIIEKIRSKIIIKWREREEEPGVVEYYNTGGLGLKNAWGHIGKNDA